MPWTLLCRPDLLLKARHKTPAYFQQPSSHIWNLRGSCSFLLCHIHAFMGACSYDYTVEGCEQSTGTNSVLTSKMTSCDLEYLSLCSTNFGLNNSCCSTLLWDFLVNLAYFFKSCVCYLGTSNSLFSKIQLCSSPHKPKMKVRELLF